MLNNRILRQKLRERYERYRIRQDGCIEVYGIMPNSIEVGWWLYGYVGDRTTELKLGIE